MYLVHICVCDILIIHRKNLEVHMKKNVILTILLTTCTLAVALSIINNQDLESINKIYGETSPYSLTLDAYNRITESSEASPNEVNKNINTSLGNEITLLGYNIIRNDEGWQSILPNGYIYNPFIAESHHNQISGIKSISYVGDGYLELHFGYLNNAGSNCLYSLEETLYAGNERVFDENHPSYIYLKNVEEYNVNITSLTIKYSCVSEYFPTNGLTVLMIGNSFADDTIYYSSRIANSLGLNLEVYNSYIGGCTIDRHYENIQSGAASYSMRSMNGSSWNYQNDMSLNDIVTSHTWDIITFQQASAEIGRTGTYSNLENLVNDVKKIASGHPKYYWHQTWAYDTDYSEWYDYFSYFNNNQIAMFNAIIKRYNEDVVPLNIFEKTIFNGTAVQNMRTSYMKDTFTRDGKHMSLVHGRFLLAANFVSTIFGVDLKLSKFEYTNGEMNSSYLNVVCVSIENARKHPNEISESIYKDTEIADYDLTNFTEIDAGLVGCSYYNCQDSTYYNRRINHVSGTSNKFVSTYRFTIDTLPVGSLVFIQEGLGYRPEAWVDDSVQASRKNEEFKNVIEIDDDFWAGYQYRAFNIFKAGKQTLSGEYVDQQYEDIFDGVHIFVPNNKIGNIKPKDYNPKYLDDSELFTANSLDIDDYERIHLDPITGFYKCDSYYYLMNSYVDDTAKKFVCTRPLYNYKGDLGAGTVIIIDPGYQYRSDCWGAKETYSPRPENVNTNFVVLDSSFMNSLRRRTFNVSSTNSYYVGQNSIDFINHLRIYQPK